MNIIVCIKQVPDTTEVRIDPITKNLVREGVKSIVNPFDAYAIEEGVRLKEKFGGKVIALTMGPPPEMITSSTRPSTINFSFSMHPLSLVINQPSLILVSQSVCAPK